MITAETLGLLAGKPRRPEKAITLARAMASDGREFAVDIDQPIPLELMVGTYIEAMTLAAGEVEREIDAQALLARAFGKTQMIDTIMREQERRSRRAWGRRWGR